MVKQKIKKFLSKSTSKAAVVVFLILFAIPVFAIPVVRALSAEEIQEKKRLEQQIATQTEEKKVLSVQAVSISDAVAKLQAQIATLQSQINDSQVRIADIQEEITIAEKELARQKGILGKNIKAMYLEGDISTLEMLATSKDLSEFVDKQQYRNSVQEKIKSTLQKITDLKFSLRAQKEEIEQYVKDQEKAKEQIALQEAEQNKLLSLNQDQQASLNQQIKENSARVTELNRKQVEENRRSLGGSLPAGVAGGGGYKYGNAVCLWPGSADPPCQQYDWGYPSAPSPRNLYDEWGYGYRNCTSWAAFRVVQVRGYTPAGLTGLGHAKSWPYNTSATVNNNPRGNGATVAVSNGTYGHVRFVENVYGDGSIEVSDYNFGGDGIYRRYVMSAVQASYLTYIHY
jgi:peptidoglycan DL-endopeptidase CwlO